MVAYSTSKGALNTFTQALALDEAENGVRVNSVCPSYTTTSLTEYTGASERLQNEFCMRIPLGRPASPDEVAVAIAFLTSDDARYITGITLPIDGGLSASSGQPNFTSDMAL